MQNMCLRFSVSVENSCVLLVYRVQTFLQHAFWIVFCFSRVCVAQTAPSQLKYRHWHDRWLPIIHWMKYFSINSYKNAIATIYSLQLCRDLSSCIALPRRQSCPLHLSPNNSTTSPSSHPCPRFSKSAACAYLSSFYTAVSATHCILWTIPSLRWLYIQVIHCYLHSGCNPIHVYRNRRQPLCSHFLLISSRDLFSYLHLPLHLTLLQYLYLTPTAPPFLLFSADLFRFNSNRKLPRSSFLQNVL